jgi:hypothetical protein
MTAIRASQVVSALADMASKGKYDNVTPAAARSMDALFNAVADLINVLEEEEAAADAVAVVEEQLADKESDNE